MTLADGAPIQIVALCDLLTALGRRFLQDSLKRKHADGLC